MGSLTNAKTFIGKPASELSTPSIILSKPVLEQNIARLHQDVEDAGLQFRFHMKTLKSAEVTRLVSKGGQHKRVIASTLAEIRGVLPLVEEGLIEECLYGLPFAPSKLPELAKLSEKVKLILMIDNQQHIDALEKYNSEYPEANPWNVFLKVDVGYHRAGVDINSSRLQDIVRSLEESDAVSIYGFYAHGGNSYSLRSEEAVAELLQEEVNGAITAAKMMAEPAPVVVSFGATPTAHVIRSLKIQTPSHITLELHAGNFVANDLQQVGTGCIGIDDQVMRVITEIASIYPERNEALINSGCIALSRETGPFPGFGRPIDFPEWIVGRLSQEHGILVPAADAKPDVAKSFYVGQKLLLHIQHACIVASAHPVYYVVDKEDIVRDVWVPWKGW